MSKDIIQLNEEVVKNELKELVRNCRFVKHMRQ